MFKTLILTFGESEQSSSSTEIFKVEYLQNVRSDRDVRVNKNIGNVSMHLSINSQCDDVTSGSATTH